MAGVMPEVHFQKQPHPIDMKDIDYSKKLNAFIAEIIDLGVDEFKNPSAWTLRQDPLNAVSIDYELPTQASRSLLHEIGQKHGLIPMCPDDMIDLVMSKDYIPAGVAVISRHGTFMISKRRG
ncbi:hypothetical protein G3480_13030 [Thiorhodococcus mannitoliphagus]|uniref:Uncharacterized protein n=1 Tax=Thiorhodococcus mannitoliphagus TaxID=329406 RepID=A0A6P1DSG7_9GAMM|nr:hypothetical protein [Thiorhodococcus mannitoliphagus]NEX21227.1 hypothetical protein [Thiorhodococcus mannitoliphagus]